MILAGNDDDTSNAAATGQAKVIITLSNRVGLHSRPAGAFVRVAKGFRSSIKVVYDRKEADGKRILSILSLEAKQGALIAIEAIGEDAGEAVRALRELIRNNFGEID